MKARLARLFALACIAAVASSAAAQNSSALDNVRMLAHDSAKLEPELRHLTDVIGGRVPGTPAMQKAAEWAVASFRDAGADSVRQEDFMLETSWAEGETRVRIVAPTSFDVRARSIAWSPALTKPLTARVVDIGRGAPAEFVNAGNLNGAILLVHSDVLKKWDDLFAEYLEAPAIIQRAQQAGAAAIAWTATRDYDILYRHINAQRDRFDAIPSVLLAREDAERIARLAKEGGVQMSIDLPNKLGPPVRTWNVVAEIKGSDLANESVLIGAHLDSWELGTGALDNGCNAVLTIEALRAIKAAGIKPRRTLRFVLFSGEEQGLLGSRAYVEAHHNQLAGLSAVIIFDTGTGQVTGYSLGGRHDALDTINALVKPFADWGVTTQTEDAFWGTDNVDFLLEGVPTLVANQVEANYLPNYHAYSDTYDKVDFPQLRRNVALAAYTVAYLGNADKKLAPRQTRKEIEKLLRDTKLDEQLKTFGLWNEWQRNTEAGRATQ
jgi:carboxypeptidase Q